MRTDVLKAKSKVKGQRAVFVVEYVKDFAARRAAEAAGMNPEQGHKLLEEEDIQFAIKLILEERLEEAGIDGSWLLYELVDNHRIARHQGNIAASNAALKILAQLDMVDALAKMRVDHSSSDGSMTPVPILPSDMVKKIVKDLEEEV